MAWKTMDVQEQRVRFVVEATQKARTEQKWAKSRRAILFVYPAQYRGSRRIFHHQAGEGPEFVKSLSHFIFHAQKAEDQSRKGAGLGVRFIPSQLQSG
jgi:hypothetical protein